MPTHLAASMRVIAAHAHMRHVTVAQAKRDVLEAALAVGTGTAGPDTERLVAKLEKVTGATIAELAVFAEDWPDASV